MTEKPDNIPRAPDSPGERAAAPPRTDTLINEIGKNPSETLKTLDKLHSDLAQPALKAFGDPHLDQGKPKSALENKSDTYVTYKNNMAEKMRFADGTERTFKRDNPNVPGEITRVEVKPPNQPAYNIDKVPGKQQYTNGQVVWNAKFETKGDQYIIHDLATGNVATRSIDGTRTDLNAKTGIETTTLKDQLIGIKKGDAQVTVKRDNKGEITKIEDTRRNTLWQQQSDKSWQASALDQSKAFKNPTNHLSGKADFSSNGDYQFTSKDGTGERFHLDGSQDNLVGMFHLRNKVEKSTSLNADQKERLLNDYLPKLESRQFVGKNAEKSNKERIDIVNDLSRLLDKPEKGGYTEQECGKMMEQLAFHSAYPGNFGQALNTCNVTDIGMSFMHESPFQASKVMAQVGMTGSYRTADGSTITPRKVDIQAALRDQPFPPHPTDPIATGVSRAFAVTAINIYWQRRTTNEQGIPVAKGSLHYAQEGGEGVFFNQNGQQFYVNGRDGLQIKDSARLEPESIVDIGEQITGEPWKNRYLISGGIYAGYGATNPATEEQFKRLVHINSIEGLHNALMVDQTQIIQLHTSKPPFHYESGYGNEPGAGGPGGMWHVAVKTKYEPAFDAYGRLDPRRSLVYIDNGWNPTKADHLTKERALPLAQLYNALTP